MRMEYTEICEFFVEGRNQKKSHVLLHITEPSTPAEVEKGYFFAIVEVEQSSMEEMEHMKRIIDDLETGYYESIDDHDQDKSSLETTLQYLNRRSASVLGEHNTIHLIAGALRGNDLSLTYRGNPRAILFLAGDVDAGRLDILGDADASLPDQLFSTILEGTVNLGDVIYVATPGVDTFFPAERVEKLVKSRTTKAVTAHMQKVLEDVKSEESFGGIFFRVVPPNLRPKTGKRPTEPQGSAASLQALINAEKKTAQTLSPPLMNNLKQSWQDFRAGKEEKKTKKSVRTHEPPPLPKAHQQHSSVETNHRAHPAIPEQGAMESILIVLGRALVSMIQTIFRIFKKGGIGLYHLLIVFFILLTNKNNSRQDAVRSVMENMNRVRRFFRSLPLISKLFFGAMVLSATVFFGSVSYLNVRATMIARQQAYQDLVQAIEDKRGAAQASVIYGDEAKAITLLQEAKQLNDTIPENSKERETQKATFTTQITSALMDLRHMTVVEPVVIADLGQTSVRKMVRLVDNLLLFGTGDEENLVSVSLLTKTVQPVLTGVMKHLISASTPKEQDKIVFLNEANNVGDYTADIGSISPKVIAYPLTNTHIIANFVYNTRLYTLDNANNQIYKHNTTQTGYDKGTPWIKGTPPDFSLAISFAIDGSIYVLASDGTIQKFNGGEPQAFTISGLEPALDRPTEIYTYNDIANLYVLEPTNKRVIVLSKEGKLIKQYTSDAWTNPTSMVIDETRQTIYLLDQNIIYSFRL